MDEITIYFIYAKDCNECEDMKNTLLDILEDKSIKNYEFVEINSESEAAIDIALENDINDIPACVIGTFVFCGKSGWTYDELETAIEKTLEENNESNEREY